MAEKNSWIAYVAVIALILAVVAVAVVLKGSVTGEVIFSSISSQQLCKTFETRQDQAINQCAGSGYPKCVNGFFMGGSDGNLMTLPISCDTPNPREIFDEYWEDAFGMEPVEPITKVYASVTCCKK